MDENLNSEFRQWLGRFARHWAIPIADVPKYVGGGEDTNRLDFYPELGRVATRSPVDMAALEDVGRKCWALGERFDGIRFREFCANSKSAEAVADLVQDFPLDDRGAAERTDAFVDACGPLGYSDPKTRNLNAASAALLASTILTAAFPKRFVDFRQSRWRDLADELDYTLFTSERPTYGEMLIAAGKFAAAICATDTFREFWPTGERLWIIAGICWWNNSEEDTQGPKDAPRFLYEEDFDEGAIALRQHVLRERSKAVVKRAKEAWRTTDPLLHCDVCGFSFVTAYGELGEGYIEAHHTKPISTLKAGAKTRVADLAKVCSNCHRMLHVDNACLEIAELRGKLRTCQS